MIEAAGQKLAAFFFLPLFIASTGTFQILVYSN